MGFCSKRYIFLSICLLQMLSVIERQVFDFLGFLWIPILVNFLEIIFIILGFFGAYQYRPKYIISYVLWHLFWLGWNVFIICLYLDIADLDHKTNKVLKLDPTSESWWIVQGPGCQRVVSLQDEPWKGAVENCYINYVHVEIFQAGIQCFLALTGVVIGIFLSQAFLEEDDTSSHKSVRKNPKRISLYSIEFSSQLDNRRGDSDSNDFDNDQLAQPVSPKPMTPRRVKRRSVMTRGSSGRHSTSSRRTSTTRSSTRNSRRMAQNPVTRLLEQQQQQKTATAQGFERSSQIPSPVESLPNYYNSVSNNNLMAAHQNWHINDGHSNPTYQQSSTHSLDDPDDFDDLYNNRPASVRSSYSNFHGTRAINYVANKHYHHSHATPQVPQKRNPVKHTASRSMAFLNNGPPGYTSQAQTPLDSETTI